MPQAHELAARAGCIVINTERDLVSVVNAAIADGIGDCGIDLREVVVPALVFELARDRRGAQSVLVFDNLQEVSLALQ